MSLPRLHLLVTDEIAASDAFQRRCRDIQEACGPDLAVHLRVRRATGRRMLELAEGLEEAAVESGGWLVVNGRVDVALAVGAEAVQLGEGALPIPAVRDLVGDSLQIGASVHGLATADLRRRAGADFLVVGTVYPTPTHREVEPAGPDVVREVTRTGVPVIAIGGIDGSNVAEVRRAGAHGAAVIRAVWDSADPVEAAGRLCRLLGS